LRKLLKDVKSTLMSKSLQFIKYVIKIIHYYLKLLLLGALLMQLVERACHISGRVLSYEQLNSIMCRFS